MLKGLYDFSPVSSKTLGFKAHENLLYLSGVNRDENWLRVSNSKGQIGLVPINYVDSDSHVSGSTIVDFLDASIQVARRDKSPCLPELLDIRRSILNPITDLECRLKEFQSLITRLKNKGSPYYNRGRASREASQHTLCNETADDDENSNHPPSFLTCDDQPTHWTSSDRLSSQATAFSKESSRIPYIQYVDPRHDNESQRCSKSTSGCGDCCSVRSSNGSDARSVSSHRSSFTYTCPPSGRKTASSNSVKIVPPQVPIKLSSGTLRSGQAYDIVEVVRQVTGISYEASQKSVQTVLQYLKANSSGGEESIHSLLQDLDGHSAAHRSDSALRSSADYERLYLILTEMSAHAIDDELWEVQDDEGSESLIQEMRSILNGADVRIIIKALEEDEYQNVHNLTLYFQREHRWPRRQQLIYCFAKMASMDHKSLSVLLNSVLPLELVREMRDAPSDADNRMETVASLLALLLSSGEKLPVHHLDVLGREFIIFVLDKIDECSSKDEPTEFANVLTNLILSYNLQFGNQDENLTIAALALRQNAKFLTQKIVHLLLWEQDPVRIVNQSSKRQDSVLKLVLQMFSCSMTADLFYTNDTKVLIDIVLRSLTNLEPGEKRRTSYLQLIRMIIRNSNFREHNHRRDDLVKIFTSILLEEDPLAVPDQRLIREITNEFPTLIK